MLRAFLQRRRDFRARIDREAGELRTWLGQHAYTEARSRMREARGRGDRPDERLWAKVAVEIARREGIEIGKQGAAKWPDDERITRGEIAPPSPPKGYPNRREIADRLVEISRGIADLSAGRADATTLHNIGAEARQILDFTGRTPDLEQAVGELIAACEGVVIAPTVEDLARGVYPSAVEAASCALQRLKGLALAKRP